MLVRGRPVSHLAVAGVGRARHAAHLQKAVQTPGFVVRVAGEGTSRGGVGDGVTAPRAGVGGGFLGEARGEFGDGFGEAAGRFGDVSGRKIHGAAVIGHVTLKLDLYGGQSLFPVDTNNIRI